MLKRFKIGGIHPSENKLSNKSTIVDFALPESVTIPVSQHIGAPAVPCVAKGDTVKVGQIIAKAAGFVSSNIHSSVSGTVTAVENTIDGGGLAKMSITIKVEGDDWEETIDRTPTLLTDCTLDSKEIITKIAEAGIVGMGGATFPTQVKLSVPPGKTAEFLVINGVECEPYLTSDHRVMLERGEELMVGVSILMKALGVTKAFIGIENNKKDAIARLEKLALSHTGIMIVPLRVMYPQGGEKQLIDAILSRQIPSGALPIEVGAVVQNVGTALAVYEAVQKNKPLFERVVTVTGKSIKTPANYKVRIGTPINSLIEQSGGLPEDTGKVINGGPMMGRAVANIDAPVTKGTSGVLVMRSAEAYRPAKSACISCSKCVTVCPMALEPYLLGKMGKLGMLAETEKHRVTDCIECGSCAYTCPAGLPLLDMIRLGKAEVMRIVRARSTAK